MTDDYSDIIDHPHHRSVTRPHMPMITRAAQFSPFAALTGYDESVRETGRLTDEKAHLDESQIEEINRRLSELAGTDRTAAITYFVPDLIKEGGSYTVSTGRIKKTDEIGRRIIMSDDVMIAVDDIFDITFIE